MSKYVLYAFMLSLSTLYVGVNVAAAQATPSPPHVSAAMAASAPRDPSLRPVLAQFGGKPGLVVLVNRLMDNIMADTRTRAYFINKDRDHIKLELVDQFCVILDGPCTYTGKSMARVHRKLGINYAAFDALVEDLQTAMDQQKIPFHAQNRLLAKLAAMHTAVITR